MNNRKTCLNKLIFIIFSLLTLIFFFIVSGYLDSAYIRSSSFIPGVNIDSFSVTFLLCLLIIVMFIYVYCNYYISEVDLS